MGARAAGDPNITIRPMSVDDAAAVLRIYQDGLDTGDASFETRAPDWPRFDASRLTDHRFVAEIGGDVVGWVAVSPTSSRAVYAGVVEHSVYVASRAAGAGIGRALLGALIQSTEQADVWTIQSGVFPENRASIALHLRCGFRVVGIRERVGRHHGRWRDVVLLERRSPVVGSEPGDDWPAPDQVLAAYGTLRPGEANHEVVAGIAGHWLSGTVRGWLTTKTWGTYHGYPALRLDPLGPPVPVAVLVSPELPDHWPSLDDFEGPEYRRVVTDAAVEPATEAPTRPRQTTVYEVLTPTEIAARELRASRGLSRSRGRRAP